MALIERLQHKVGFTPNEVQLADFVLANLDEVPAMGISQLAERAFTSKAAISRFCKKIGMGGYRDFQVALASEAEKARQAHGTIDVNQPFHEGESAADAMADMAALSREAINVCYAATSPEKVKQAARLIAQASRVYLYANGDSMLSALAFSNMALKLGVQCVQANQYGESVAHAYVATRHDVALIISYSYSLADRMPTELEVLRRRGCRIIAITSRERPAGADLALTFPHREEERQSVATFYSQQCIRFILNCIYAAMYTRDFEGSSRARQGYERLFLR